jgi:hypothetical protein
MSFARQLSTEYSHPLPVQNMWFEVLVSKYEQLVEPSEVKIAGIGKGE